MSALSSIEADSWFNLLPIDDYLKSVENTIPEKIPEENSCPSDYSLGDLSVACGPLVRFLATHENDTNNYRGTILLVLRNFDKSVSNNPKLLFMLGPSVNKKHTSLDTQLFETDASNCEIIHEEGAFTFLRYSFSFELISYEQRVKYSFDNFSLPHFQFFIPSMSQSMNIMSYSCNGFSLNTDTTSFRGSLWLDVVRRHNRPDFHYHVMIGGGDQIYADSIKNTSQNFNHWLKHKHIHSKEKLTPEMEASFDDYYLNRYIEWFGKGFWVGSAGKTIQAILPVALASIPQLNIFDDHDIIDGFGSYADITMRQEIFQGVGKHAFKYYMLFQQHTPYKESPINEPSWIIGKTPGPYINELSRSIYARLGSSIAFLGLDCRTERTKNQIVYPETYDIVFQRIEKEVKKSIQNGKPIKHLLVLLGVPICYPRMVFLERIMESPLIRPILYLARKGIIAPGLVNEFDGEVELLDDLNDHWCAHHHKKERNELMGKLVAFGEKYNTRITILSGDVHLCCISRFRGNNELSVKNPKNDPEFILNLISSAIVNAPPPDGMVRLLSNRSKKHIFEKKTHEDMIPLFTNEPGTNVKRDHKMFLNKRNYSDIIPISNLPKEYKSNRYGDDRIGKFYLPGSVSGPASIATESMNISEASKTNGNIGYPYDDNGLVATLRVEVDRESTASETGDYEILVPSLEDLKMNT